MAASFFRKLFDKSSRRRRLPKPPSNCPSLKSRQGFEGLAAAESLETRAMLAFTGSYDAATETLTLTYDSPGDEAVVELYNDPTTGRSSVFWLDVDTAVGNVAANVAQLDVVSGNGSATDVTLTLQTTQGKTNFQLIGDGDGLVAGTWESPSSGFVGLRLEGLETHRVRTPATATVSGDFTAPNVTAVLDVVAGTISAAPDGTSALAATNISLQATQVDVGTNGVSASDVLELSSTAGLTVAAVQGVLEADAAIKVSALNDIDIGSSLSTGGTGTVSVFSSQGGISLANTLSVEGAVDLSARTDITLSGDLVSNTSSISLATLGNVVVAGDLSASTDATISGDSSVRIAGDITASAVSLVSDQGTTKVGGVVTADTSANITGGSGVTLTGGLVGNGTTAQLLSLAGTVAVDGAIDVGAGSVAVKADAVNFAVPASVTAATLDVESDGEAVLAGSINATGTVDVEATNAIRLGGVTTSGDLTLISQTGSVASSASVTAQNSTASIDAPSGGIDIEGDFTAASVALSASGAISVGGSLTASKAEATLASTGGNVTIAGEVSAATNLSVQSGEISSVQGDVAAVDLSVEGRVAVDITGGINVTGTLNLTSPDGSVRVAGEVDSSGPATFFADTDVTLSRSITTKNSAVTISAGNDATLGGVVDAGTGNFTVNADGNLAAGASSAITGGNLAFTVGGESSFGGSLSSSGTISATSSEQLAVSGSVDAAVTSLKSTSGSVLISGTVGSANATTVTISSEAAAVTVFGAVTATDGVVVEGVENVTATGAITSTAGNVSLTSSQGALVADAVTAKTGIIDLSAVDSGSGSIVAGKLTAAEVRLVAGVNATLQADAQAQAGNVTLEATGGQLRVLGSVDADGGNVLLRAQEISVEGAAVSGDAVNIAATGSAVTIAGGLTAKTGDITLTSFGDATIAEAINASQSAVIRSQSGSVDVFGTLTAGSNVSVSAANGTASLLESVSGSRLDIRAGRDLDLLGKAESTVAETTLLSTRGNITFSDLAASGEVSVTIQEAGTLTVAGSVVSDDNITLQTATGNIAVAGELSTTNDAINLLAGGDVQLSRAIAAGTGDVAITAGGDISTVSAATITGNNLEIAGESITLNALTAAGAVNVTAGQLLAFRGAIASDKTVTASGVSGVSAFEAITATSGSVDLTTAEGGIAATDTIIGQAVTLAAPNGEVSAIDLTATVTNVSIASGGNLALAGTINALDVVAIQGAVVSVAAVGTKTASINGTDVTLTGLVVANGSTITVTGDNAITIPVTGGLKIIGSDDITLVTGGELTVAGTLEAGNLALRGDGGISITGQVDGNGSMNLTAQNGTVSIASAVGIDKTLEIKSANGVTFLVPSAVSVDRLTIETGGGSALSGTLTATGAITITSEADASIGGLAAADSLTVTSQSGNVSTATAVNVTNGVTIDAAVEASLDAVTGKTIVVDGDAGVSVRGLIDATGGDINLTSSGGNVGVTAAVTANGALLAEAAGTLSIGGVVTSVGDLTLVGDDGITTADDVGSAAGSILMKSTGGAASINGSVETVAAGKVVEIDAVGDVFLSGDLTTNNGAVTLSGKDVTLAGDISSGAGSLDISTVGNVSFTNPASINSGAVNLAIGADASLQGDVTAGGNLLIDATGDVTIPGDVQTTNPASGALSITSAQGELTVSGLVSSAETLNLSAVTGLAVTGSIAAENNVGVTSAGAVNLADVTTTIGRIDIAAGQSLVTSTLAAETGIKLVSGLDASVSGGVITTNGDIQFQTDSGDLAIAGVVDGDAVSALNGKASALVAGNLTLQVGAGVVAGTTVSLSASGIISTASDITAQVISLSGTAGIDQTGALNATAGTASLTSDGAIAAAAIAGQGGVSIRSSGDNVTLAGQISAGNQLVEITATKQVVLQATAGINSGTGNLNVTAGTDISAVTGSFANGKNISFSSGGDSVLALVNAGGDLNALAGGALTLNEEVTAGGSIAASAVAGGIFLNAPATAQDDIAISTNSAGNISVGSINSTTGDLRLTSADSIRIVGALTAAAALGKVNVSASNVLVLDVTGSVNAGFLAGVNAGTFDLDGSINSGNFAAQASGSGDVSGPIVADGSLSVTAVENLAISGDLAATGQMTLASQEALIDLSGNISGSDIDISGALSTTVLGDAAATGNMSVRGLAGDVTVAGDVDVGAMLTVEARTNGSVVINGGTKLSELDVFAPERNVTIAGAVSATGVNGVTIRGGGTVAVAGISSKAGPIDIRAATGSNGDLLASGGISSDGQNVTLIAGEMSKFSGGVAVSGAVSTAGGRVETIGYGTGTVVAVGSISSGAGTIKLSGEDGAGVQTGVGGLISGQSLNLAADADVSVGGDISITGNVDGVSQFGNFTVSGAVSGGSVDLFAGEDVVARKITVNAGNGGVTINAGRDATSSGVISLAEAISTQGGGVALRGRGNVSLAGPVTTQEGDLTVAAGTSPLDSVGSVAITSVVNTGGGDVLVEAFGDSQSAVVLSIQAGAGDISITAPQGKVEVVAEEVLVGNNVTVTSSSQTTVNGNITATGEVRVSSTAGSTSLAGVVDALSIFATASNGSVAASLLKADQDVTLNAEFSIATGKIQAGDEIGLAAGTTIAVSDVQAGQGVQFFAGSAVTTGDIQAGDLVRIWGGRDGVGGNVSLAGNILTGGEDLQVTAGSQVNAAVGSVSIAGDVQAGTGNVDVQAIGSGQVVDLIGTITSGDLTVRAPQRIEVLDAIASSGQAEFRVGSGTLLLNSTVTADSLLGVAPLGIQVNDNLITNGGGIELTASEGGISLIQAITSKTTIDLTAGGSITTVEMTAGGDVDIAAGTNGEGDVAIIRQLTTTGDDVLISAGSNGNAGAVGSVSLVGPVVTAGGDVSVTAIGANEFIDFSTVNAGAGDVRFQAADGELTLRAGGSLIANNVDLIGGTATAVDGAVVATGNVNVAASSGGVAINGTLSGGSIDASALAGSLTVSKAITSGNSVSLIAGETVEIFETVRSQDGNVAVRAEVGPVLIAGQLDANLAIDVSAPQGGVNVAVNSRLQSRSGDVLLSAGGGAVSVDSSVAAAGNLQIKATDTVDIGASAPLTTTNGKLSLASIDSTVTLDAPATSGGAFIMQGSGAVSQEQGAAIQAVGDIEIDSDTGGVTFDDSVRSTGGSIEVTAQLGIANSLLAPLNAANAIFLASAAGGVDIDQSITATTGEVDILAPAAISTSNVGSVSAGGRLLMSTDATITIRDDVQSGGLMELLAENTIDVGILVSPLTSGGGITLRSQAGAVVVGSAVQAAGNIEYAAATSVRQLANANLRSTGGDLSLSTQTGAIVIDTLSTITAAGDISVSANGAGGSFSTAAFSPLTATGGTVTLAADEGVSIGADSPVTAGVNIQLTTSLVGADIQIAARSDLAAGASVVLSSKSEVTLGQDAGIKAAGGGVTIGGSGNITFVADTVLGAGLVTALDDVVVSTSDGALSLGHAITSTNAGVFLSAANNLVTLSGVTPVTGDTAVGIDVGGSVLLQDAVGTTELDAGTIIIAANQGIRQTADAPISTGTLTIINDGPGSAGNIDLSSAINSLGDVNPGTFAAISDVAEATIELTHTGDLIIGVGSGADGVTTVSGDITVRQVVNGDIVLNRPVDTTSPTGLADPANIRLISFGALSDTTSGFVVANELRLENYGGTGAITLDTDTNEAAAIAIRNFAGSESITYVDATDLTIGIDGEGVRSELGDITVQAGLALTAAAEVYAGQAVQSLPATRGTDITLDATIGITQTASQVVANNLLLSNVVNDIVVTSTTNDIEQLVASNGGGIAYTDFDDFETGVVRTEAGLPLDYEIVSGGALQLFAGAGGGTAIPSIMRVVSGLAYETLSLRAGASETGDVGTVELVTTSNLDNPEGPGPNGAFEGTLRDMIVYANDNRGRQVIDGVQRVQPQLAVFDERFYSVTDIVVEQGLPGINQTLSIDGTRVEQQVTDFARVGIDGSQVVETTVVNGLTYVSGSSESTVSGLAIYGFETGAGLAIQSGVNTVTNLFAGLERDGSLFTDGTNNLVGIDLAGRTATRNTIGAVTTSDLLANTVGGNEYAGIVVRRGAAGNVITGNYVGTNVAGEARDNKGDGIRINASNGNSIGHFSSQAPDFVEAQGNVIRFNQGSGVRVTLANAASRSGGNFITNNVITDNDQHGVRLVASAFQTIGGEGENRGNVIGGHTATGSAGIFLQETVGVEIAGNRVGLGRNLENVGNETGLRFEESDDNIIHAGNQIGFSTGNAIEIAEGSDGNRIEGNFIGATIDDNLLIGKAANAGDGVLISRSLRNDVDGDNLIAFNSGVGVNIVDSRASSLLDGNAVGGNKITENAGSGVVIHGGGFHTIGGDAGGNVISLNGGDGIQIEDGSLTASSVGNVIDGNFVGTNESLEDLLGNAGYGISITEGGNNTVKRNFVLGNGVDAERDGIRVMGSSGNTIGSDLVGQGNVVRGNGRSGLVVTSTLETAGFGLVSLVNGVATFTRSQAGQVSLGDDILISGFLYDIASISNARTFGVVALDGGPTSGVVGQTFSLVVSESNENNRVYGNTIAGNVRHGVEIHGQATHLTTVGQMAVDGRAAGGAANVISDNWGYGIYVDGASGVTIEGNSIQGNGGLTENGSVIEGGIKLDNGANEGAVAPTLSEATVAHRSSASYTVTARGSLASAGQGTVVATGGAAVFTVDNGLAVGDRVIVGDEAYEITSVSGPTSVELAGAPTFSATAFEVLKANQIGQNYFVDFYLNQPWLGNSATGAAFEAAEFLGRASVLIGTESTGSFEFVFTYASSDTPLGMFMTATATTSRPANGVTRFSTSEISDQAVMVEVPTTADSSTDLLTRSGLFLDTDLLDNLASTNSSSTTSSDDARRDAFGLLGR